MKESEFDDIRAIHLVLSGDVEAFRYIADKYGTPLHRYCLAKIGNDDDAFDLAQETLFRAFKSLKTFRLGENFPAWLFAIAANVARTRIKRAAVERRRVEGAGAELVASDGSRRDSTDGESLVMGASVRDAVAALPEEYRVVVELHYFEGHSALSIAGKLGLGEEGVKTRLFRARKMLREAFDLQPGGSRGGSIQ